MTRLIETASAKIDVSRCLHIGVRVKTVVSLSLEHKPGKCRPTLTFDAILVDVHDALNYDADSESRPVAVLR